MNQKRLREKAALLKDGQVVQIGDNFFRAAKLPDCWDESPCNICELDSICHDEVTDVCNELDGLRPYKWYLELARKRGYALPK